MRINRWQRLKWTIPIILFLTTIIDATIPALFPSAFLTSSQIVISHLTLYYIIIFAFYFRDSNILIYAFVFGLFYDMYNTTILGVYASLYVVCTYLILQAKKYFPKIPILQFMFFIIAIFLVDFLVYLFYFELKYTSIELNVFLGTRLAPTIIYNIVLAIIMYFPSKFLLKTLGYEDYIIF